MGLGVAYRTAWRSLGAVCVGELQRFDTVVADFLARRVWP